MGDCAIDPFANPFIYFSLDELIDPFANPFIYFSDGGPIDLPGDLRADLAVDVPVDLPVDLTWFHKALCIGV